MCDVGYLCANFRLPMPLCSRLRPDVRDRQTDRQTSAAHHRLIPLPYGRGIKQRIWELNANRTQLFCACLQKKTRTEPKGTETVTFGTTLTEPNPRSKGSAARILQSLFTMCVCGCVSTKKRKPLIRTTSNSAQLTVIDSLSKLSDFGFKRRVYCDHKVHGQRVILVCVFRDWRRTHDEAFLWLYTP